MTKALSIIGIPSGQKVLLQDGQVGMYTVQLAVADNGVLNIYIENSAGEVEGLDPGDGGYVGGELHFRVGRAGKETD